MNQNVKIQVSFSKTWEHLCGNDFENHADAGAMV